MDINPSDRNTSTIDDVIIATDLKFSGPAHLVPSKPPKGRLPLVVAAISAVVVATITGLLWLPGSPLGRFESHEGDTIDIAFQRGEGKLELKIGEQLQAGDYILIEVQTSLSALLWTQLYGPQGPDARDAAATLLPPIRTSQGVQQQIKLNIPFRTFMGTEVLVILVCDAAAVEGIVPSGSELIDLVDGIYNHDQEFMKGCRGHRFPLKDYLER